MNRRGFITGLVSVLAAPAIVRVANIMPVKALPVIDVYGTTWATDCCLTVADIQRCVNEMRRRSIPPIFAKDGQGHFVMVRRHRDDGSPILEVVGLGEPDPALLSSPFSR